MGVEERRQKNRIGPIAKKSRQGTLLLLGLAVPRVYHPHFRVLIVMFIILFSSPLVYQVTGSMNEPLWV